MSQAVLLGKLASPIVIFTIVAVLAFAGAAQASPYQPPQGAPPIAQPTPPAPPNIGEPFVPTVAQDVQNAFGNIFVISLCRFEGSPLPGGIVGADSDFFWTTTGAGNWIAPTTIAHIQFVSCLNFDAGGGPGCFGCDTPDYNVYIEFNASPWGAPQVFRVGTGDLWHMTLTPGDLSEATYVANVILTDGQGVVLDHLDPGLILSDTLPPTTEPGSSTSVGGTTGLLQQDALFSTTRNAKSAVVSTTIYAPALAGVVALAFVASGWYAWRRWLR